MNHNIQAAIVIAKKELLDGVRDKRSLMSIASYLVMSTASLFFILNLFSDMQEKAKTLELPVVGAEYAPELIAEFKKEQIPIIEAPKDIEQSIKDKEHDVVLVIKEEFNENLSEAKPAELQLWFDSSRTKASGEIQRVKSILEKYSRGMAMMRLISRGVSPQILSPVRVDSIDISSDQKRSTAPIKSLPMLLLMGVFMSGIYLASDQTAGERERGSMETLLLNPVPPQYIVLGKWISATLFSLVGSIFSLILLAGILMITDLEKMNIFLTLDVMLLLKCLLLLLPLSPLAMAASLLIGSFANSFKEAQTYIGFLMMVPMAIGMMSMFDMLPESGFGRLIPLFGQQEFFNKLLASEPTSIMMMGLLGLTTILNTVIFLAATTYLFKQERMIFKG